MRTFYYILRKKKIHQRKEMGDVFNTSSIGDIAFLLLIFFIVTSSFILRQGIFLHLPSPSASPTRVDQNRLVELRPTGDGFLLDNKEIERRELVDLLTVKQTRIPEMILVIQMASNIEYSRLVDAVSVARESGIKQISLKNLEEAQ